MKQEINEARQLTVYNFEYAVSLNAPMVSLFRFNGKNWRFVRNAKFWNGINICLLEQMLGGNDLQAFPVGMIPDQVWQLLHKLERQRRNTV